MTAGASKAATTITQPALAPSPQPRPAPTARALPSKPGAQRGQNWTPIRGQICKPIDRGNPSIHPHHARYHRIRPLFADFTVSQAPGQEVQEVGYVRSTALDPT